MRRLCPGSGRRAAHGGLHLLARPPQNGDLPRQRKNPERLCIRNTLRALDFFASVTSPFWNGLHVVIFLQSDRRSLFERFVKKRKSPVSSLQMRRGFFVLSSLRVKRGTP
jgi:hypothetical protein